MEKEPEQPEPVREKYRTIPDVDRFKRGTIRLACPNCQGNRWRYGRRCPDCHRNSILEADAQAIGGCVCSRCTGTGATFRTEERGGKLTAIKINCPDCRGAGVLLPRECKTCGGFCSDLNGNDCPDCKGKGFIPPANQ